MKIVNYEEEEMIPLTKEERSLLKIKKLATYAKKSFVWIKMIKIKLIEKRLKIIVITQENLDELLIANATYINYKVPKDIPIIIHNASYDTHFIINQLAEELKSKLKGGLLTVLDLCRLHYQNLLITCLEFLIV